VTCERFTPEDVAAICRAYGETVTPEQALTRYRLWVEQGFGELERELFRATARASGNSGGDE
jgi:hypothetical protein